LARARSVRVDLSTRFTAGLPCADRSFPRTWNDHACVDGCCARREGGIGVIDRGFRSGDITPQIGEVTASSEPATGLSRTRTRSTRAQLVGDAIRLMDRTRVGTLVVVARQGKLAGLLTRATVRFTRDDALVSERMTPRDRWSCHSGSTLFADGERLMADARSRSPVVNADDTVLGLMTARDLVKHRAHPFASATSTAVCGSRPPSAPPEIFSSAPPNCEKRERTRSSSTSRTVTR
jgi:hypothetical protein